MTKSITSANLLKVKTEITNKIKELIPRNQYLMLSPNYPDSPKINVFDGDKQYSENEWSQMPVLNYDDIGLRVETTQSVNSDGMCGDITIFLDSYFTIESPFDSKDGLHTIAELIDTFLELVDKYSI